MEEQLYDYITKLPMKAGDKLPNEFKLAEKFGVGRSTIREAVKLLVSRNVLETRRGSASNVRGYPLLRTACWGSPKPQYTQKVFCGYAFRERFFLHLRILKIT